MACYMPPKGVAQGAFAVENTVCLCKSSAIQAQLRLCQATDMFMKSNMSTPTQIMFTVYHDHSAYPIAVAPVLTFGIRRAV